MIIERWKNIRNYEGLYSVSNLGRIKRLKGFKRKNDRILKPVKRSKYGHECVYLSKNTNQKQYFIHRLVLETFISQCPPGMECRHLDGKPWNNELTNLCWGTKKENQEDSKKHGTRVDNRGSNQWKAILNDNKVKKILKLLELHESCSNIAKKFNISIRSIYYIKQNKTWTHIER